MSLATKYRPQTFQEVVAQESVKLILQKQIETKSFSNCLIYKGCTGSGKTTVARIFAKAINNGLGTPIEVDAASHNSVDDVRLIIEQAQERALDSEYKVWIIDECHLLSNAAWNALLKLVEEPPKYTVIIFCTTDPQKIPMTIQNRCQIFNFGRIPLNLIIKRLDYICLHESIQADESSLDYIAKLSEGSLRQAISYLDKCKDYSNNLTINSVIECLGNYSYDIYFDLTNAVIDGNKEQIIKIIEYCYNQGTDLKLFVANYLKFILQLDKYILLKSMNCIDIPAYLEDKVKYVTGIENNVQWFSKYLDKVLDLKCMIKNDSDIKTTIEVTLIA